MKSILFLQNLGAGEIVIIALVFFFIFFIVRSINSATDERKRSGNGKVLRKGRDRVICGVCSGIAEYLEVSTLLVRLVFLFTGVGMGLYLVMAILMND